MEKNYMMLFSPPFSKAFEGCELCNRSFSSFPVFSSGDRNTLLDVRIKGVAFPSLINLAGLLAPENYIATDLH